MVAGRGKGFAGTEVGIWGTMGLEVAGRGKGFTGTAVWIWVTVGLEVRIGFGVGGLVARDWIGEESLVLASVIRVARSG
jgi:hypothetical protein